MSGSEHQSSFFDRTPLVITTELAGVTLAFGALTGCVSPFQHTEKSLPTAASSSPSFSPTADHEPIATATPVSTAASTATSTASFPWQSRKAFYRDPGTCASVTEPLPAASPSAGPYKSTPTIHVSWSDRDSSSLVCEGARNMTAEEVLAKAIISSSIGKSANLDVRPEYYSKETALAYKVQRVSGSSSLELVRISEPTTEITAKVTCTASGITSYVYSPKGVEQTGTLSDSLCSDGTLSTEEIASDVLAAGKLAKGNSTVIKTLVSFALNDAASYSKGSYKPVQISFR